MANGNLGCNGGWMADAWEYLKKSGIERLADYPYTSGTTGKTGTSSKHNATKAVLKVASYVEIPAGTGAVAAIKQALGKYGPVPVALDASRAWSSYKSGIFSRNCSASNVNHAVIIVGYSSQSNTNYWIVRNQWGTSWGDKGYILMKLGINQCGIESYAQYPVIKA